MVVQFVVCVCVCVCVCVSLAPVYSTFVYVLRLCVGGAQVYGLEH